MEASALEAAIMRIPGVEATRVVLSSGHPTEVHVLTVPGKPPKQVVRDVQSVALARFGTQLDRRIVSVVQMDAESIGGSDRPMVEDIAETIDGSRMTVSVTLAWQDRHLVGSVTGPAASSTRLKLIADATLAALEQALDQEVAFAVSAVDTPTVGGSKVAVAVVVIVAGGAERTVCGSALAGSDPARSMVRAVLDALNRQVPTLRRQ
jgi:hypothetical protein